MVGFPFFDSHSGGPEVLGPALTEFLEEGPPPIVFTLGTFAVLGPGDFYARAAEVARALGRRAVLLTGEAAAPRADGDIFRCGYVPHSLLFPRAAVIVHHGGVGTTGQALRAGKPQLIVPHMGDQHDHAHRIERLGVGLSLKARQFAIRRAVPRINRLLDQPSYREQACRVGRIVAQERGADNAAAAIADLLSTPPPTDDGLICD
jgi:UDP:flavonoid glycosyltransferase YjiC (YdhE family)